MNTMKLIDDNITAQIINMYEHYNSTCIIDLDRLKISTPETTLTFKSINCMRLYLLNEISEIIGVDASAFLNKSHVVKDIQQRIDNMTNNIILDYQSMYDVISGDIEPAAAAAYERLSNQLADVIADIVEFQIYGGTK